MKYLVTTVFVAYAVLLGAPRTQSDLAALALQASLFFAEVSVILSRPSGDYSAGSAEPNNLNQDT
ncbi:hypothetical protein [uncultured Hyphomicrobium sp.]|uniref:hypothetical protein n=1 Tax=uncultured Hyphomicrobium sp. TaxID=194373 RepID=UPI0025F1A301|nr:hypothetical protein [uncultured Hyphomicrobium sp.]